MVLFLGVKSTYYGTNVSRESPAHVRPVTPTHVPSQSLYLQPRFLTYSYSASNVLNHYALIYLAQSIASN
jgi:hypothetical protein